MNLSKKLILFLLTNVVVSSAQSYHRISFKKVSDAVTQVNNHLAPQERYFLLRGIEEGLFKNSNKCKNNLVFNYLKSLRWIAPFSVIIPSKLIYDPCFLCKDKKRYAIVTPCCNRVLCRFCFFNLCIPKIEDSYCFCSNPLFLDNNPISEYLFELLQTDDFDDLNYWDVYTQEYYSQTPLEAQFSTISNFSNNQDSKNHIETPLSGRSSTQSCAKFSENNYEDYFNYLDRTPEDFRSDE